MPELNALPCSEVLMVLVVLIAFVFVAVPSVKCLTFCDQPDSSARLRVIGGTKATKSEFPWQAAFVSYDDASAGLMCGATVIDEYWIMTAAHCILSKTRKSYILTGLQTIRNPQHTAYTKRIVVHPQYDASRIANDIALVQSKRSLFNSGINSICLTRNDSSLFTSAKKGLVTGFGLHIVNRSLFGIRMNISNVVLKTTVPIIPLGQCQHQWWILSGGTVTISNKQICAGSKLHGTAPGDSGGPLLVHDAAGRLVQVGITSFGAGGGEGLLDQGNYPGLFFQIL
ncbi:unnamed protein product [Angiostrongylus costaricensis]|uniref:Peptidase S1 domain-containing protein n=1 Tax=Angiostrongylus costaricensis TaxID=334426 RepID=A0A158PHU1_ANGCS|nr:unnamed protein product [Angiostrongylus costaricensis]